MTVTAILSCRKTTFMVAGVLVCVLLCHQKGLNDKTKTAPARTSTGLPWQLSMAALSVLLSLPHMAQDKLTSPCDPPRCTPPQKHKPAIYKNFSADSEQIPASCKSSHVMQPSQPLLPGLEKQKVGCAEGNGNH